MDIITSGSVDSKYGGYFTGAVQLEMLRPGAADGEPDTARVSFADGALTNWHVHPGGQQILLLSGRGRAGTDGGDRSDVEPGTLVWFAPGERHWHGAAAGTDCVWLANTWGVTAWENAAPSPSASG